MPNTEKLHVLYMQDNIDPEAEPIRTELKFALIGTKAVPAPREQVMDKFWSKKPQHATHSRFGVVRRIIACYTRRLAKISPARVSQRIKTKAVIETYMCDHCDSFDDTTGNSNLVVGRLSWAPVSARRLAGDCSLLRKI
jgi:uncharacterized protein YlaI